MMKKAFALILTLCLAIVAPLLFVDGKQILSSADELIRTKTISSVDELITFANQFNNNDLAYAQDVAISVTTSEFTFAENQTLTPIGTATRPFKGTFDGNGVIIKNLSVSDGTYQGLFGYTNGATIQNLQISGDLKIDLNGAQNVYAGAIVGYADKTNIKNCELDRFGFNGGEEYEITNKLTFGTMAGLMHGGSIENSASYMSVNLTYNLAGLYDTKIGGIIGSMSGTKLERVLSFANLSMTRSDDYMNQPTSIAIGGLFGSVERANGNSVTDCVFAGSINVNDLNILHGALVGENKAVSPYLHSVAYKQDGAFGNGGAAEDFGDNAMQVDETIITDEDFYKYSETTFMLNGQTKTFKWSSLTKSWFGDKTWLFTLKEMRLQLFQHFTIAPANPFSNRFNNETYLECEPASNTSFSYGETCTINFNFVVKEGVDYSKYFDLNDIKRSGTPLEYKKNFERVGDNRWLSPADDNHEQGEVELIQNSESSFTLNIKASSSTSGNYSVDVTPHQYLVAFASDGNGGVDYVVSGSSTLTYLPHMMQINDNTVQVLASPSNKYTFDKWELYYPSESGDFEYRGEKWAKSTDVAGTVENRKGYLTVKFGEGIKVEEGESLVNKACLFRAIFKYDPLKISSSFDTSQIEKVVINDSVLTQSTNSSPAEVGKSEPVTIKIYVKNGVAIDADKIVTNIKSWFKNESAIVSTSSKADPENKNLTIYEFSFDSANVRDNLTPTLTISTTVAEQKSELPVVWIVVGVVGGVLLLAGIGLLIFFLVRKKRLGGGDDYKKMYF